MSHFYSKPLTRLATLVSLALVIIFTVALQPAQAQEPDGYTIFLPLIRQNGATTTPPIAVNGSLFIDTQFKTSSAGIQVDAQGGMHLVYYYYEPINDGAPTSGVYLYCRSQCHEPTHWTGVGLGEQVNEIQLQLTPAGQPPRAFPHPLSEPAQRR